MKYFLNKKTLAVVGLVMALTLLMVATCFADDAVTTFIKNLTQKIKTLAILFIALSATITAVLYMLGAANPKMKSLSKDALYALIVGVIILVLSGNIANYVANIVKDKNITEAVKEDNVGSGRDLNSNNVKEPEREPDPGDQGDLFR